MLINPYIYQHIRNSRSPKVVETEADGTMYVGDCLPNCNSYGEKKWLIKLITTDPDTGLQQILLANGSSAYDQSWRDRKSLKYKVAVDFDGAIAPDIDGEIPAGALCDQHGNPILTIDNQYIILI